MSSHQPSNSPALPIGPFPSHPYAHPPSPLQQHFPGPENYGAHQDMANAQHQQQQQSVIFSQQNPQMIMQNMQNMQYMPHAYMVRQGAMMSAQPPPTPQQSAAIRQTMMMPPRFSSPMPQYQQHQQQQQPQPQTGFVQHEQQQYSMLPPDSNYHMAAAPNIHPAYYQAMQVQQQVQQRSDGSMPGNAPPPPQVYATGSQIQQQNPQPWQMYQQPPSMPRFQPMVSVRFPQQMPMQRMMAPSMQQQPVGMPQEMPTEVVARPPMHVGEPAQRPQFIPRQQRSDIVYYDPLKAGNDVEDKASQATKPKAKSILAIIDPSTGQNVLETLEMSSRQTSNEALKIQSEFAHKVTQRISLGDKAPNFESRPAQPLHGDRPVNLLATAPAYEIQPLEVKPDDGLTSVSLTSAGQEVVNNTERMTVQGTSVADVGVKGGFSKIEESLSYEAPVFVPAASRTQDVNEKRLGDDETADVQPGPEGLLLDSGVESLLEEPFPEVKEGGVVELSVVDERRVEEKSREYVPEKAEEAVPEKIPDKVQVKVPDKVQEKIPDKVQEKIPEKIQEKIPEKVQEKIPEKLQEKIPERVQEKIPEKIQEKIPEKVQEKIPEKLQEKIPERVQEKIPEKIQEKIPEKVQEKVPEKVQEKIPEKAQEKMPENLHEKIPEKVQEKIPEKVQAKIPEKVQEKIPEKVLEKSLEKAEEKELEKVQVKAPDKVQETVNEKAIEKVPEKALEKVLERPQGPVPVAKLPQVEREEILRPPLVAKQLEVEQEKSELPVFNIGQFEAKEEKTEAPIPTAARLLKEKETAEPRSEIADSKVDLSNNFEEKLEKSVEPFHPVVNDKLTLVDATSEPTVGDVESLVDAAVDENNEEEVLDELEDGEIVEPKDKAAAEKPQYSYEPGQWTPLNPDGKKVYSRDFLLQLQFIPESILAPPGLPDLPEIVRGMAPAREMPRDHSFSNLSNMAQQYSGFDFTPRFAHDSMSMGRAPVKRGSFQKRNEPPVKVIHIRRPEDVQLHKTEQAWKPAQVIKDDAADPEAVKNADLYKKMRGILNKITPSTFEKLLTQILELPIDNENRLSGCIAIIFEKAISEPKFVKEYSNLAQRMMTVSVPSTDNPAVKVTFRKLLLNRCQEEFEKDQQDERDIIRRQKEIEETTTEDQKKRLIEEKEALVSASRRRSLGNIRFIGELFKLKMLTEKIMHDCIKKLLDAEDEDSLELLCNLLKTIGKELDTDKAKKLMDTYFVRLGDKQGSVPSRIRFMIKDLLEQRKNKWIPRRAENIPKTIVEIHKEANEEKELAKQQLLNRAPPPPKPRQDRRLPGSSSTEKPGDDGWTMAVSSNTKNRIDTSKMMQIAKNKKDNIVLSLKPQWQMGGIGGMGSRGSSQEAEKPSMPSNRFSALENLGAPRKMSDNFPQRFSDQFASLGRRVSSQERSSSQELRRDNSPHGAVQRTSSPLTLPVQVKEISKEPQPAKELSREIIEHKSEALLEEYLHLQDIREAVTCVKELESPKSLHLFVSFAINYVLEKKELARILTGTLLHQLFVEGVLSFEQCELGFKEVLQEAESLAVDIPKVWEYLGEIVASTIKDNVKMWQLLKTGCQELAPNRRDVLFRKTVAVTAHKLGADRTSMALRISGMRWSDFVNSGLFSYAKQNNLEHLDPVREELIALLKQHSDNQPIFEWIQRNVTPVEAETREFIRALVTAVCTRAIMASETSSNAQSASYSVSEAEIVSRQTLLQRHLDHKPDREIQALYALQALVHSLEHPSNILHSFFNILYDKDIIAEEAFWEWQNSTDPAEQNGKGVAFQSVKPFFDWLSEGTEEPTGS